MSTHTPGPWRWTWQEERTCYALKGGNGPVLEITKGLTPAIDDQRLIAAAPALLEALESLEEVIRQNPHLSGERLARVSEMKEARAAIAQAKGESHA